MIRHLSENFIKVILLRNGMDPTFVHAHLQDKSLPEIKQADLDFIRRRLRGHPLPEELEDENNEEANAWLKSQAIQTAFRSRSLMSSVDVLFNYPAIQEALHRLVVGGLTIREIELILWERHHIRYSAHCIKLYKHYYWNTDGQGNPQLTRTLTNYDSTGGYVDILRGGRLTALWREGIPIPLTDEDLMTSAFRQMGMRCLQMQSYANTPVTVGMLTRLAVGMDRLWRSLKATGVIGLEDSQKDATKYFAARRLPLTQLQLPEGGHDATEEGFDEGEGTELDDNGEEL